MSTEVDNKVVSMKFDNSNFEQNVKTSMSTLDKLKDKLNFSDSAKAFEDINAAARATNFTPLSDAVQTVHAKFSAFEIMAITALQNITNSAINTGKQLVKSLSIDQISAGFDKYTDKTTAVQTIVSATGKSAEDVNKSLAKLNWFTDETSYNFTDMVGNIGKFTSMGIDLDKSITAMEGIATWAAKSGQGVNEASRAMYNLSQAMGVGSVKLQDWKSIENANMATKEFKEVAIETAKAIGTLDKEGKTLKGTQVSFENFSQTLSEEWFSSDVLLATLNKYGGYADKVYDEYKKTGKLASEIMEDLSDAGMELGSSAFKAAQESKTFRDSIEATKDAVSTGWMQTFEIIFGNLDESKELWSDFTEVLWDFFASGTEGRNKLLEGWKELGGRDSLIQGVFNIFEAGLAVMDKIKEAFRAIFPPKSAKDLVSLTKSFEKFTERLIPTEKQADKLQKIFEGLFSVVKIVKDLFSATVQVVSALFGVFTDSSDFSALDFFVMLAEKVKTFSDNLSKSLKNTKSVVKGFIKDVIDAFHASDIAAWLSNLVLKFRELVSAFQGSDLAAHLVNIYLAFKSFIDNIGRMGIADAFRSSDIAVWFSEMYLKIDEATSGGLTSLINNVKEKFGKLSEYFKTFDISGYLSNIYNSIKGFFSKFKSEDGEALDTLKGKFDKLRTALEKFWDFLKTKIGVLFAPLVEGFKKGILALKEGLSSLGGGNLDISKIFGAGAIAVITKTLMDLLKSIDTLVNSGKKITDNIGAMFDTLNEKTKPMKKGDTSKTLRNVAISIGILTLSMVELASLSPEQITTAVLAISAVMYELVDVFGRMNNSFTKNKSGNVLKKIAKDMVIFAVAIRVMASSMEKIGNLDIAQIAKGVAGIGALEAELVGVMNKMQNNKAMKPKSMMGLVILAEAIKVLAKSVKSLGELDVGSLAKGTVAVGVLLGELVGFVNLTKSANINASTGVGLILLAESLKIVSTVVSNLGTMDIPTLAKGIVAFGLALYAMVGALALLPKDAKSKSEGLLIMGAALFIVAKAIAGLASLDLPQLAMGVGAIVVALGAMVGAAILMKKASSDVSSLLVLTVAVLGIAAAFRILGELNFSQVISGLVAVVGGLLAMVMAAKAMEGDTDTALAIIVMAGALLLLAKALTVMATIPIGKLIASIIGLGVTIAILVVAANALSATVGVMLAFGAAIALVGIGLLSITTSITMFVLMLESLGAAAPGILVLLVLLLKQIEDFIINLIRDVVELIPFLIQKIGEGIMALVNLLVDNAANIGEGLLKIFHTALDVLRALVPDLLEFVLEMLLEVLTALVDHGPEIVDKLLTFLITLIDGLSEKIPELLLSLSNYVVSLIEGFAEVIERDGTRFAMAIRKVLVSILHVVENVLKQAKDDIKKLGKQILAGLIQGIKDKINDVKTIIKSIGEKGIIATIKEVLGIKSPSKVFEEIGNFLIEGFINGVKQKIADVKSAISEVASTAVDKLKGFLGINSPSKVFAELGGYSMDGYIVGVNKKGDAVTDAIEGIGDDSVKTFSSTINRISDAIGGKIDFDPTIRPVLDLSEVEDGASDISSMLSGHRASFIASTISTNKAGRNASVDDLTAEIGSLKDSISDDVNRPNEINLTLHIDDFHNNDNQDIESLADELSTILASKINRRSAAF